MSIFKRKETTPVKVKDDRIPDSLKFTLTQPILERLSNLLDIPGQTFIVRKYLRYPPNKKKADHVYLPANGKPHEFDYPPTVQDIEAVFPEYGGGVYQVFATKPQPQYIYSLTIDWKDPKEPFKGTRKSEEEEEEEEKKSKKKTGDIEKLLEDAPIDDRLKTKLLACAFAKKLGIPVDTVLGSSADYENPIDKAIAEYLNQHPEVLKEVAQRRVKQILGLEEDEVERAWKWRDFLYSTAPPYYDPFASSIFSMLPFFFQLMMPGLAGGKGEEEELVKIKTKSGRTIYMTRKDYEEWKRKKTRKIKKEKIEERREEELPPQLKELLSREPEEVAAQLVSNEAVKPYIRKVVEEDMGLEGIIELAVSAAPQYKSIIEKVVNEHKEWFERLLDAVKELYKIETGEEEIEEVEEVKEEEKPEEKEKEESEKKEEELSSLDFSI